MISVTIITGEASGGAGRAVFTCHNTQMMSFHYQIAAHAVTGMEMFKIRQLAVPSPLFSHLPLSATNINECGVVKMNGKGTHCIVIVIVCALPNLAYIRIDSAV